MVYCLLLLNYCIQDNSCIPYTQLAQFVVWQQSMKHLVAQQQMLIDIMGYNNYQS